MARDAPARASQASGTSNPRGVVMIDLSRDERSPLTMASSLASSDRAATPQEPPPDSAPAPAATTHPSAGFGVGPHAPRGGEGQKGRKRTRGWSLQWSSRNSTTLSKKRAFLLEVVCWLFCLFHQQTGARSRRRALGLPGGSPRTYPPWLRSRPRPPEQAPGEAARVAVGAAKKRVRP